MRDEAHLSNDHVWEICCVRFEGSADVLLGRREEEAGRLAQVQEKLVDTTTHANPLDDFIMWQVLIRRKSKITVKINKKPIRGPFCFPVCRIVIGPVTVNPVEGIWQSWATLSTLNMARLRLGIGSVWRRGP